MSDRGMKKWAPYRSLPEKDVYDNKMKKKRNVIEKPLISNEKAEEINNVLLNHNGNKLVFKIYENDKIVSINDAIKSINTVEKTIRLVSGIKINIKDIVDVIKDS